MSITVAVCDYGVGNLRSVERALAAAGAVVLIGSNPEAIAAADGAVLPGVGAFAPAAGVIRNRGLAAALADLAHRGRPVLGVCLGFQLLFESSEEGQGGLGLGLFAGRIRRLAPVGLNVPHTGWNRLHLVRPAPLLEAVDEGAWAYFVHSYAAESDPGDVVASTDYGGEVIAACQRGSVMGTQFHPEKSGPTGLRIYANFVAACAEVASSASMPAGRLEAGGGA